MTKSGRVISSLTGLFNRVLALAIAAGAATLAVSPELAGVAGGDNPPLVSVETVERFRIVIAVLAVLILCLNLNVIQFVLFNVWNSESRRYISSKGASGTARVSLDAIQRSLVAVARSLSEIAKVKLEVYRTGHTRFKVEVMFWMREGPNVINISEKLRLVLKKRFAEIVSISPQDRVDFDITLAGIHKLRPLIRSEGRGSDVSPGQFKGPVYPVEGDG